MTVRERILIASTVAVVAAHGLGTIFSWYELYFWYDILTHFFGGFWVATVGFVFLPRLFRSSKLTQKLNTHPIRIVVLFVFAITLLWELFELIFSQLVTNAYGISIGLQPGIGDTLIDIILGLLGAFIAGAVLQRTKQKPPHSG